MIGPVGVQARIATIQSRIAALSVGPSARGGGVVGGGQLPGAARPSSAVGSAPVPGRVTAPRVAPPGAPARGTAARGAPTGPVGLGVGTTRPDWASRLPGAGRAVAPMIEAAAEDHGLRPELLAALVWTESGFRDDAVSPAGAIGLGQLMPGTAAELGVDPRDPRQNLDGAARYLRQQLDRFGDTRLALAAYNAGPGRVADAGGVPAIPETTAYVARVAARARTLGGA